MQTKGQNNANIEIIKAWKDQEYRDTLTMELRSQLLEHPAGVIDLLDPAEMDTFQGASAHQTWIFTCCKKSLF